MYKTFVFLLICIILSGCAAGNLPQTYSVPAQNIYSGYRVENNNIDTSIAFSVTAINSENNHSVVSIALKNDTKNPIKTNSIVDELYAIDKDQTKYLVPIPAINRNDNYYKSKALNPKTMDAVAVLSFKDPAIYHAIANNQIQAFIYYLRIEKMALVANHDPNQNTITFDTEHLIDLSKINHS